jgi:hypothetical protein
VARRDFPLFADFEVDSIVAAGHNNTAVVEVDNAAVVEVDNNKVGVESAVGLSSNPRSFPLLRLILAYLYSFVK